MSTVSVHNCLLVFERRTSYAVVFETASLPYGQNITRFDGSVKEFSKLRGIMYLAASPNIIIENGAAITSRFCQTEVESKTLCCECFIQETIFFMLGF